ncbi:MAG TPA: hypothetical protein VM452_16835 [Caulifigura sp.]|nr:hypothetical protein [Caulifigura sp.]
MRLAFHCPACSRTVATSATPESTSINCPCGWQRPVSSSAWNADNPRECLACGNSDLWRQKDFPQRMGLIIIAVQVVLTTMFWSWHRPVWTYTTLILFAVLDMIMFAVLPDVLVCYRCRARHGASGGVDRTTFDLETAERYRQERLRTAGK